MKPLTAGSEIDAYCTKCRMDLGHRIVAMVQTTPKRVICQTCFSEHNYHQPRAAPKQTAARRIVDGATKPKSTAAQRVTQKAQAEADRVRTWEARIAGKAVDAFRRYALDVTLSSGELVRHSKFGEGYVVDVVGSDKVNIMFRDGPRLLARGKG